MATALLSPYDVYNVRRRRALGLERPEDVPTTPPVPSTPSKPQEKPAPVLRPKLSGGGANLTQGNVSYSDIEPEPPYPSDEDRAIASGAIEASEERYNLAKQTVRNWKQYSARKGEWENDRFAEGIVPGGIKASRLNMLSNYGQDFANIDLDNRRMWETRSGMPSPFYPDGSTPAGGGWVPMDQQTFDDVTRYRALRDSTRGQNAQKALGFTDQTETGKGPDLRFAAVQRLNWLDRTTRAGHLTLDPSSGHYYNIGSGDPNDPSTWEWISPEGKELSGPPANAMAGKGGMLPNYYYLNNTPGATYALPGQTQLSEQQAAKQRKRASMGIPTDRNTFPRNPGPFPRTSVTATQTNPYAAYGIPATPANATGVSSTTNNAMGTVNTAPTVIPNMTPAQKPKKQSTRAYGI